MGTITVKPKVLRREYRRWLEDLPLEKVEWEEVNQQDDRLLEIANNVFERRLRRAFRELRREERREEQLEAAQLKRRLRNAFTVCPEGEPQLGGFVIGQSAGKAGRKGKGSQITARLDV